MKIRVLNTRDRRIVADAQRLGCRLNADIADCRMQIAEVRSQKSEVQSPRPVVVNVVMVNNRRIRELNRRYLKRDRPTDVIAFPLGLADPDARGILLGEVYVSRDQARLQARENGVSYHDEVRRLVLHGILHILGLTHRQMEPWYKRYLL